MSTCSENWRVEAADLATGVVRAVLYPISMEWSIKLNDIGEGQMTLAVRDVAARDIWPHLTALYISRVRGDGATPTDPVPEYGAIIEKFSVDSSNGIVTVGFKTIESYMWNRMIRDTHTFEQTQQTRLAKQLVDYIQPDGIQLVAVADSSIYLRDRTYWYYTRKIVGEAVQELTGVINGLDWEMRHFRTDGVWESRILFRDIVGADRNIILQSDVDAYGYGLDIDAATHANFVDALGAGEEEDQRRAHADDLSVYPRFDAAPLYAEVTRIPTLQNHADGYLQDYKEPFSIPAVTLRGLEPSPLRIKIGDVLVVDIDYGVGTFYGVARIREISWSVSVDEPETRNLDLEPIQPPSESVFNQTASGVCDIQGNQIQRWEPRSIDDSG